MVFQNQIKVDFTKKKLLLILKNLLTRRKIVLNILVRFIDQYAVFTQKRCLEIPPEKDHVGVL